MRVKMVIVLCFCLSGLACVKGPTPWERSNNATRLMIIGYTNANIQVAERALRDYQRYLIEEESVHYPGSYKYEYAGTTERLIRICEHQGKTDEAAAFREELRRFISNAGDPFATPQEISELITKVDDAHGWGTSIWTRATTTTNFPPIKE